MSQKRTSIEWSRIFPSQKAYIVGEVTSYRFAGQNNRVVEVDIIYRDGSSTALQGNKITLRTGRGHGLNYQRYSITLNEREVASRDFVAQHSQRSITLASRRFLNDQPRSSPVLSKSFQLVKGEPSVYTNMLRALEVHESRQQRVSMLACFMRSEFALRLISCLLV